MADVVLEPRAARTPLREVTAWERLKVNRDWLSFWFMLPAAAFLILFLAYPLGLGIWLSFTDARIGRPGVFVGLENYEWLSTTRCSCSRCSTRCSIPASPASSNSRSGSISRCCSTSTCRSRR